MNTKDENLDAKDSELGRDPEEATPAQESKNEQIEAQQNDPRRDAPLTGPDESGLGRDTSSHVARDDKGLVIGHDLRNITSVAWRFILIVAGLGVAGFLLKYIWVGLLPVLLAILVASVLYPVSYQLRKWKFPRALASLVTILGTFAIIGGIFTAMAPTIRDQSVELWSQAEAGINEIPKVIEDLPFNVDTSQIENVVQEVTAWVQNQASNIFSGVMSGFSIASSIAVTLLITLVITFFMLKDGDIFLPWMRKYTGPTLGWHVTELFSRIWKTLSGFIQTQAIVSFVDAVLIGLGLWALGVPLAFVLATLTFFAGFIPIIGAITAGFLAVVIALVSNGVTNALLVLALIVLVQQIEGNVLQPILQSRAMGLHASIVLLSVTVGSTLAGIIGAFLAVPVAATIAVIVRYHAETVALRSGEISPDDVVIETPGSDTPDSPRTKVAELFQELSRVSYR